MFREGDKRGVSSNSLQGDRPPTIRLQPTFRTS